MLKIDIFNHILPLKYKEALSKVAPSSPQLKIAAVLPTMYDLDHRFRLMDKFEGYIQVPTMNASFDDIPDMKQAIDLARLANDSLAELVFKWDGPKGTLAEMEKIEYMAYDELCAQHDKDEPPNPYRVDSWKEYKEQYKKDGKEETDEQYARRTSSFGKRRGSF